MKRFFVLSFIFIQFSALAQNDLSIKYSETITVSDLTEYLEVIAVDPAAPEPGRARWFGSADACGRPQQGGPG